MGGAKVFLKSSLRSESLRADRTEPPNSLVDRLDVLGQVARIFRTEAAPRAVEHTHICCHCLIFGGDKARPLGMRFRNGFNESIGTRFVFPRLNNSFLRFERRRVCLSLCLFLGTLLIQMCSFHVINKNYLAPSSVMAALSTFKCLLLRIISSLMLGPCRGRVVVLYVTFKSTFAPCFVSVALVTAKSLVWSGLFVPFLGMFTDNLFWEGRKIAEPAFSDFFVGLLISKFFGCFFAFHLFFLTFLISFLDQDWAICEEPSAFAPPLYGPKGKAQFFSWWEFQDWYHSLLWHTSLSSPDKSSHALPGNVFLQLSLSLRWNRKDGISYFLFLLYYPYAVFD